MKWDYWICLFTGTHCTARGLRSLTIEAYKNSLVQFHEYVKAHLADLSPDLVTARHVLEYVEHLRRVRDNGDSAINRHVTILKNFYRAIVAMGHLEPAANPMAYFPKIKAKPRKLPVTLSVEEVTQLLKQPPADTVVGVRDRAILALLYGTGIRASECAGIKDEDVDFDQMTARVTGKGGHERTVPMNEHVAASLRAYRRVRGDASPTAPFFRSRRGGGMSRNALYERVRTHAQRAGINKRVSPHILRHTCATHLVRTGASLVDIRDLLGHRQITSTQIYLHVTAEDLRRAADLHPIARLAPAIADFLPEVKLPFQRTVRRGVG